MEIRPFRHRWNESRLRSFDARSLLAIACVATALLPTSSVEGESLPQTKRSRPAAVAAAVTAATAPVVNAAISAVSNPVASVGAVAESVAPVSEALVADLARQAPELQVEVLRLALDAARNASNHGLVKRDELLTVIDYSLPSTQKRMFVFDVRERRLLFRELVAHGKNSGDNYAKKFSNEKDSFATSLGLFVTGGTYYGGNGYSLKLDGLEKGVNDQAMNRSIVIHGAAYVSEAAARSMGRIGRSWGCPAVRSAIAPKVIDTLKGGSPVFAYYPDETWLTSSAFLDDDATTQIARVLG